MSICRLKILKTHKTTFIKSTVFYTIVTLVHSGIVQFIITGFTAFPDFFVRPIVMSVFVLPLHRMLPFAMFPLPFASLIFTFLLALRLAFFIARLFVNSCVIAICDYDWRLGRYRKISVTNRHSTVGRGNVTVRVGRVLTYIICTGFVLVRRETQMAGRCFVRECLLLDVA